MSSILHKQTEEIRNTSYYLVDYDKSYGLRTAVRIRTSHNGDIKTTTYEFRDGYGATIRPGDDA